MKGMKLRRWILKAAILAALIYAMVRMWHWKIGFTFFTQLSNLFAGLAVILQGILPEKQGKAIKFSAVVSILVTGVVYATALGPFMPGGLMAAYAQDHYASLCLHVIIPTLMMADFLWNDRNYPWRKQHALLAMLPPMGYLILIILLGQMGVSWHGMAAPYLFLNYWAPAGWFGFRPETAGWNSAGIGVAYVILILMLLFYGLGRGLIFLCRLLNRRGTSAGKAEETAR